mgnify:CR=1 FL=1
MTGRPVFPPPRSRSRRVVDVVGLLVVVALYLVLATRGGVVTYLWH